MTRHAPTFSAGEARAIGRDLYGIDADVRVLPSYEDQNFQFDEASGRRWVLKISHDAERRDALDLQNRAMEHVAGERGLLEVPRLRRTVGGSSIEELSSLAGRRHYVRLLTWVDGAPWASAASPTPELLQRLGRHLGELDHMLAGFSHAAMRRRIDWDLRQFSHVREHLSEIENPVRREMAERVFDRFDRFVAPRLGELHTSVIHNDVNTHNLLVDERGELAGLIDFGDVVHTATVCEIAIATAYFMLHHDEPFAVGAHLLRGYHAVHPLDDKELEVLFDLACARLATSVTFSALFRRLDPENAYIRANESAAWQLLEAIDEDPERARRGLVGVEGSTLSSV